MTLRMNTERFDIFVSYAHPDGEIVATLISRLEDENIHAFADRRIHPGDDWLARLEMALRESEVILFLMTPNSVGSNWVSAEAGAAWILKKKIIPVILGADPSQLMDILRRHQVHDLKGIGKVDELIAYLRNWINPVPTSVSTSRPIEIFTEPAHWQRLLRIGDWSRIEKTDEIVGSGMHNYLLSSHQHGPSFSLTTRFVIKESYPVNSIDAVNAGIVLGWTTPGNVRRYFNLLMTGERLLLEHVGGRGGDAYSDFVHLNEGVEFDLLSNVQYIMKIAGTGSHLRVYVTSDEGTVEYTTVLPEPIVGRVGIRPWRATMICRQFQVVTE